MTPPPPPSGAGAGGPARLRRAMGFRDLLLFYIVTGFSLRWIAAAAAAGPSALVIWWAPPAVLVPLVFTVLELSSRYPGRGRHLRLEQARVRPVRRVHHRLDVLGLEPAVLSRSLLYFAAGERAVHRRTVVAVVVVEQRLLHHCVSMAGLALAVTLNVVGLNVGKWLHNVGAIAVWIPAGLLIGLGARGMEPLRIGDAD